MSEPKRPHPAFAARAAAAKVAHAELTRTQPGFRALPAREQFRRVQVHIRTKGGQ